MYEVKQTNKRENKMFKIGDNVFVDDGYSMFEGVLLNDESSPVAKIQEIGGSDGEGTILTGSWDFVDYC